MSAAHVRKAKPKQTPVTLAELVEDIEARLEPAETPEDDVWMFGADWNALLKRAAVERITPPTLLQVDAELSASADRFHELRKQLAEVVGWGPLNGAEDLLQVVRGYVMALDIERERAVDRLLDLAEVQGRPEARELEELRAYKTAEENRRKALGFGFSKTPPQIQAWGREGDGAVLVRLLLEGGEGCVIAADDAREVSREIAVALAAVECRHCGKGHASEKCKKRPAAKKPEKSKKRSKSKEPCSICGEDDGHGPADCVMADPEDQLGGGGSPAKTPPPPPSGPTMVERLTTDREEACERRLNGKDSAKWRRAAKKAREENSFIVCHHCGAGMGDDTGGLSNSYGSTDGLPGNHTFCHQCRNRLRANPREWDRHTEEPAAKPKKAKAEKPAAKAPPPAQIDLTEAIAEKSGQAKERKPPNRPTKKFPLGTGATEKCTRCGAELGEHAGTKCPVAVNGSTGEEAA